MRRILLLGVAAAATLAACARRPASQAAADSAARDIQLPRTDSTLALNDRPAPPVSPVQTVPSAPVRRPLPQSEPAPLPPRRPPVRARLEVGTTLEATATREISSRHNKPGELLTARVADAVTAPNGRVIIPAGSEIVLSIVALKPAPDKSAKDGTLELRAESMTVNGESRPLDADVTFVEHSLKARGVTGSEVAKVGVGAAAGAVLGKVIGGGTGAAVGAATGAAAGTAVAIETADRDVVIPLGGKIRLVLRTALAARD